MRDYRWNSVLRPMRDKFCFVNAVVQSIQSMSEVGYCFGKGEKPLFSSGLEKEGHRSSIRLGYTYTNFSIRSNCGAPGSSVKSPSRELSTTPLLEQILMPSHEPENMHKPMSCRKKVIEQGTDNAIYWKSFMTYGVQSIIGCLHLVSDRSHTSTTANTEVIRDIHSP